MQPEIQNFIDSKDIAILGASPSGKKFGNYIYKTLRKKGFNLYPVHPTAETIEDDKAFNNLKSLPDNVDSALIAISPDKADTVINDAIEKGIKRLWFQQGADFSGPAAKAKSAGIEVVSRKCILMYAQPVSGIHAIHRFFAKLFGRL